MFASWLDLTTHVTQRYTGAHPHVEGSTDAWRFMLFLPSGRTQVIVVSLAHLDNGAWVELLSPVAPESAIDARTMLLENAKRTVGAFAITEGGMIVYRYALPLLALDPRAFDYAVETVGSFADAVEEVATAGGDQF